MSPLVVRHLEPADIPQVHALYQKHGFVVEGTCRNFAFQGGRYADVHLMARVTA